MSAVVYSVSVSFRDCLVMYIYFFLSSGKRGPKGERGDPGKAHPGPPGIPGIQGNVATLNNCNWDVATILSSRQQKVK